MEVEASKAVNDYYSLLNCYCVAAVAVQSWNTVFSFPMTMIQGKSLLFRTVNCILNDNGAGGKICNAQKHFYKV